MSNFHAVKAARKKEIRYNLSNADIDRIKVEATKKGTEAAFEMLLGLTCLVLHNSYGFGKGRCTVVMERITSMFAKMDKPGGYTLQDIRKAAKDLGGIKGVL